jgi:hypothetical protein
MTVLEVAREGDTESPEKEAVAHGERTGNSRRKGHLSCIKRDPELESQRVEWYRHHRVRAGVLIRDNIVEEVEDAMGRACRRARCRRGLWKVAPW